MADSDADAEMLPLIEQGLADRHVLPRLPAGLNDSYGASLDLLYRRPNRISVAIFTLIFDLFLLSQMKASPELVPLSAALRLGVFTPAVLLFLGLDLGARLQRRAYEWFLLLIAVLPGIVSAVICVHTTSTHSLSDVHATTLILLVVGLIFRMRMAAVAITAVISFTVFLTGLLLTPVIPREEIASLVLTDFSIAAAVIVFSVLLHRRDRLLFLLNLREQVRAQGLRRDNQGLRRQVELDGLTGLANRRCFDETLSAAWRHAAAAAAPISLIMMDVDHFKRFNDHYGHQGGDDCLRRVAQAARREVRDGDLLARYGGEEFAVILPGAPLSVALRVAERVRAAVATMALPHEGAGPGQCVSISLGVASTVPRGAEAFVALIEAADQNLYKAKRAGRNRVSSGEDLGAVLPVEAGNPATLSCHSA